ncbi:MAG: GNAT family N-acetyltransferase, partial [Stackebrandtia sp.]
MKFRTAVESDFDRVLSFGSNDPINWPGTDRHRAGIADGSWRLSLTWLAVDGDTVVAMARFWAPVGHDSPESLDGLYVDESVPDRAALASELLGLAHKEFGKNPEYHMFLPANWSDNAAVSEAVAWRREALAKTGMTEELERRRFKWTPDAGVPEPDPRLEFRPADDETFVDAFVRVSHGSLDVGTAKGIAEL